MTDTCTDAIRCPACAESETTLICESCEDRYDPQEGCQHDGHQFCPSCLTKCSECRDAARWVG